MFGGGDLEDIRVRHRRAVWIGDGGDVADVPLRVVSDDQRGEARVAHAPHFLPFAFFALERADGGQGAPYCIAGHVQAHAEDVRDLLRCRLRGGATGEQQDEKRANTHHFTYALTTLENADAPFPFTAFTR